jgi:hypothetical protein
VTRLDRAAAVIRSIENSRPALLMAARTRSRLACAVGEAHGGQGPGKGRGAPPLDAEEVKGVDDGSDHETASVIDEFDRVVSEGKLC